MISKRAISIVAVFVLVQSPAWAQVNFVEDFLGNEINSNDWATGDNGWIVSEGTVNRATVDTQFDGRGRVFARSDFDAGMHVNITQDFSASPISNRVTVTWDYLDGTDFSVNRMFVTDTNGTNGIILWFDTVNHNLRLEAAAAGYFLTDAYGISARGTDYATISVTLDPATDLATIWAASDNGNSAGPFTVRFHNGINLVDLDSFATFTWQNQAVDAPGSDWNLTTITIREHPPIAITRATVNDTVGVQFDSEVGVVYGLESTTETIALTGWAGTGAYAVGDGGQMTLFDPAGNDTNKAYRIVDIPIR